MTAADGGVTEQAFVYDGPNVLFVFTTRDGVTTARRWLNAYGLDKRYGFEDYAGAAPTPGTGAVYEVHQDYLGSVVAVVDPVSRTVVSEYAYDSFGQRDVRRAGVAPGYGFTGQQVDAETGLGYFRMRYYDPGEGRFLSEDPLGFPDGPMNAYAYVANAPYQSVDPFGLSATSVFGVKSRDSAENAKNGSNLIGGIVTGLALNIANWIADSTSSFPTTRLPDDLTSVGLPGRDERGSGCRPTARRDARRILPLGKRTHGGPAHNWAINRRIAFLKVMNIKSKVKVIYTEMTKDQQQKNVFGKAVSTCRPDLQYNFIRSIHYLEEYYYLMDFTKTINKMRVMQRADPFTAQLGFHVGKTRK